MEAISKNGKSVILAGRPFKFLNGVPGAVGCVVVYWDK